MSPRLLALRAPSAISCHSSLLCGRQASTLANAEAVLLVTVPEARTAARFLRAKVPTLTAATTVEDLRQAKAPAPAFKIGRAHV